MFADLLPTTSDFQPDFAPPTTISTQLLFLQCTQLSSSRLAFITSSLCLVMELAIISKEFIKPTSPTPQHLRIHKLSFLDQFVPPTYVPMLLFYANQEPNVVTNVAKLLKQSLSEVLTLFYPFAGRIKDSLSIDCNDEGAYYVEARVSCPLNEFLSHHGPSTKPDLLPTQSSLTGTSAAGYVAMLQVTTFACGGIVIGAMLSHLIVDGPAATTFLKTWAALTRKSSGQEAACPCPSPIFNASSLFPPSAAYPKEATVLALIGPFLKKGICGSRRFVFDASAIALLRAKSASSSVQDPTRVEAVSALLCKCIMATSSAKPTIVNHVVNIRRRAVPAIPEYSMGNYLSVATALVAGKETTELDDLVCHMRKEIRKIDGDFVQSLKGDGGLLKYCEHMEEGIGKALSSAGGDEIGFIWITSWCNFGLYEIDFGWGKPSWVSCTTASTKSETVFSNIIVLMDTRFRDGIEAWVFSDEQSLALLDQNQEILGFASLDQVQ